METVQFSRCNGRMKSFKLFIKMSILSVLFSNGAIADECSHLVDAHFKSYEQKLSAHADKAPRLGQNFTKESLASYDALKKAHREEGDRLIQEMKITGKKTLEECQARKKMGQ